MPFTFEKSPLEGVIVVIPKQFGDERGFFMETYQRDEFVEAGIDIEFVQDNHSLSSKGVLRGVHYQRAPHAQAKLVRVTHGSVWDVAVDMREGSKSFGEWFGVELSAENHKMLYVPKGFGHGFLTLEDNTHFLYKCSDNYSPECEGGVIWSDETLNIEWPIDGIKPIISAKDVDLPRLGEARL